jgi:hypothetical protein
VIKLEVFHLPLPCVACLICFALLCFSRQGFFEEGGMGHGVDDIFCTRRSAAFIDTVHECTVPYGDIIICRIIHHNLGLGRSKKRIMRCEAGKECYYWIVRNKQGKGCQCCAV